jgi:hypothetical protein
MRNTAHRILLSGVFGAALIGGVAAPGMAQADVIARYDCGHDYDWNGDGYRDQNDYDWWYQRHHNHDYHDGDNTREECEE